MDMKVSVYGVPNGFSYWGPDEDASFFKTFYGEACNDDLRFIIEIRKMGDQKFCYYHYQKYKNIIDGSTGRAGSFFGISLRFDEYYTKADNIYRLLGIIYNNYFADKILKKQGDNLKYNITDFNSCGYLTNDLEKKIGALIGDFYSSDDSVSLDRYPICNTAEAYNINECDDNYIERKLHSGTKLILSPFYPTTKENDLVKQHNAQIRQLKQENLANNDKCNEIQSALTSEQQKSSNLNSQIQAKDRDLQMIKNEVETLRRELNSKRVDMKQEMKRLSQQLRQSLDDLVKLLEPFHNENGRNNEKPPEPKRKSVRKGIFKGLNLLLFILMVVMMFTTMSIKQQQQRIEEEISKNDNVIPERQDLSSQGMCVKITPWHKNKSHKHSSSKGTPVIIDLDSAEIASGKYMLIKKE